METFDALIVEDDPFKEAALREVLEQLDSRFRFETSVSVQTALLSIRAKKFDLVLLDMALPSHDRSRGKGSPTSMPSGGLEILLTLNRLKRLDPIIVVTQYPEVDINGSLIPILAVKSAILGIVRVNLLDVIHYDQTEDAWRDALIDTVKRHHDKCSNS